jgi:hypothetical protein
MTTISIIRGDDVAINATFKNETGTPINITGYTLFFTVKEEYTSTTDVDAAISKTITSFTSPTIGNTVINLTNNDTENLTEKDYYYDFQLKDTTGKIASTVRGLFSVTLDITRRES